MPAEDGPIEDRAPRYHLPLDGLTFCVECRRVYTYVPGTPAPCCGAEYGQYTLLNVAKSAAIVGEPKAGEDV